VSVPVPVPVPECDGDSLPYSGVFGVAAQKEMGIPQGTIRPIIVMRRV